MMLTILISTILFTWHRLYDFVSTFIYSISVIVLVVMRMLYGGEHLYYK